MILTKDDKKYIETTIEKSVENFARIVGEGFIGVDKQFEQVDKRFEGIEATLRHHTAQLDTIEQRLELLQKDVDFLKKEVVAIRQELGQFITREEYNRLDKRLKRIEKVLNLQNS